MIHIVSGNKLYITFSLLSNPVSLYCKDSSKVYVFYKTFSLLFSSPFVLLYGLSKIPDSFALLNLHPCRQCLYCFPVEFVEHEYMLILGLFPFPLSLGGVIVRSQWPHLRQIQVWPLVLLFIVNSIGTASPNSVESDL